MAPIFTGRAFGFGRSAASSGPSISNISATGGNVDGLAPGNGYKYHTFTSPGTFTISSGNNYVEFLIVGGGGSGGAGGGGGGAGGIAYSSSYPIGPGTYPVTVGTGGTGSFTAPLNDGTDSIFNTISGKGGGGGNGRAGGSGGGNGGTATQPSQPTFGGLVTNYGNNGAPNPGLDGSGGGGANAVGNPDNGGAGGSGRQFPQFTGPLIGVSPLAPLSGYFGGGGGGATRDGGGAPLSNGGTGGGGAGTNDFPFTGNAGTNNTGGGGGGGGTGSGRGNSLGGNGGSGIVVIRYLA